MRRAVKDKGSEHCGVTTGGTSMQKRETWRWNTAVTVQEAASTTKRMFKKKQQRKSQEDNAIHKEANIEANTGIAVERARKGNTITVRGIGFKRRRKYYF